MKQLLARYRPAMMPRLTAPPADEAERDERGPSLSSLDRRPGRTVQLRYATLPSACRPIGIHYWFVLQDQEEGRSHRWEVWQTRDAGGTSWGHVHWNLMHPDRGVGGGPARTAAEWTGRDAEALSRVLADPTRYPYGRQYRAWPGPNSNTYVAWVLRQAGIPYDLDPRGIGKDYLGLAGAGRTSTFTGVQLETPLVGVKLGLREGAEVHLLCLTFGLEFWPPALKTPFGRLGAALGPQLSRDARV